MKLKGYYIAMASPKSILIVEGQKFKFDHYAEADWARPVKIGGYEQYDFFVNYASRGDKAYTITEGKTGRSLGGFGDTIKEATTETIKILDKVGTETFEKAMGVVIEEQGISPRYTYMK